MSKNKLNDIKKLVDDNKTEKLEKLHQYNIQNAWFDVDFGGLSI